MAVHKALATAKKPPKRLEELDSEDFILFRRDQSHRLYHLTIYHLFSDLLTCCAVEQGQLNLLTPSFSDLHELDVGQ